MSSLLQHHDGVPPQGALSRRAFLRREIVPADPPPEHWIRVHRRAMACRFEITLRDRDAAQIPAAHAALDEIDRIEARLSVFRETSAISDLNRRASQESVTVDRDFFELLVLARRIHRETGGAFDITSTPLSRCWGFLRREGRLPDLNAIDRARAVVGMDAVALDSATASVRFARTGIELNLGSIGKGWALDAIARDLDAQRVPRALLSAGSSSVRAVGRAFDGWPIDITSARAPGVRLARLSLCYGALATSGAGEQFVEIDGTRYGHVLDPRTGWPASGVLSASVITDDAAVADALSTAFLVGGPSLAKTFCATHPRVLALVTPDDGSLTPLVYGEFPGVSVGCS